MTTSVRTPTGLIGYETRTIVFRRQRSGCHERSDPTPPSHPNATTGQRSVSGFTARTGLTACRLQSTPCRLNRPPARSFSRVNQRCSQWGRRGAHRATMGMCGYVSSTLRGRPGMYRAIGSHTPTRHPGLTCRAVPLNQLPTTRPVATTELGRHILWPRAIAPAGPAATHGRPTSWPTNSVLDRQASETYVHPSAYPFATHGWVQNRAIAGPIRGVAGI